MVKITLFSDMMNCSLWDEYINLKQAAEFIFSMPIMLMEHVIPELLCMWTEIIDSASVSTYREKIWEF